MGLTLNESEVGCLKKLAALYEQGVITWHAHLGGGWESIGVTAENHRPVLGMMQQYGFLERPVHTSEGYYTLFTISPSAVQAVRELELEKKKLDSRDIVEHIQASVRRHPFWGYAVLAGLAVTFAVTAANQLVSLLKNLGVL